MKKTGAFLAILVIVISMTLLFGCAKDNTPSVVPVPSSTPQIQDAASSALPDAGRNSKDELTPVSGEVVIAFDYAKQSGYASNQYAVWIEDTDGRLIKTLYATRYTANGGYQDRPDSIPAWVEKSGLAEMAKTEIDAITGATPKAGSLAYTWDLTDLHGNIVKPGEYNFFVEGSLRWKNRVIYCASMEIGNLPVTVEADAEYFFEAGNNQPALSKDSPESAMIGTVTAHFIPIKNNAL